MSDETNGAVNDQPQCFGGVLLGRKIGEGGIAEIFEGKTLIGDRVVIKRLKPGHGENETEHAKRLFREGRLLARLATPHPHRNIVTFHHDGATYVVMDFVDGATIADHKPLEEGEVVEAARQLASALVYVHARGIIHRDLKPDNVMLVRGRKLQSGWVQLLDFGVAKDLDAEEELTQPGKALGSLRFMAPEQLFGDPKNQVPANAQTDIFSFGWMLQGMLTGKDPLKGMKPGDMLDKKRTFEFSTKAPDGINQELWALICQCTKLDPNARPKSMKDVLDRLETIASRHIPVFVSPQGASEIRVIGQPGAITSKLPAAIAPEPKKVAQRNPKTALGALFAAAAALVLVVTFGLRNGERSQPVVPVTSVVVTVPTPVDTPTPEPIPPLRRPTRPRVVRAPTPRSQPRPTPPPPPPTPRVEPPHETPRRSTVAARPLPPVIGARQAQNGRGYTIPGPSHWGEPEVVRTRRATCTGLRAAGMERATGDSATRFHAFCDGH